MLTAASPVRADEDDRPIQTQRPQNRSATVNAAQAVGSDEVEGPSILEGVPALNGLDRMRDVLRDRYGFYLHGEYIGDPYANLRGGIRRGGTYAGRLDVQLDVDGGKALGLPGGTLHANMYQIHGGNLSRDYIGNFLSSNDIAADASTRLYELWYEQRLGDKLSIRAGQQGTDVEFITSNYAASFIDATFGWPGLPSENLPDGGDAYPLAAPALRLKYTPKANVSILAAIFDGAPAGPCRDEAERCDRYGLNFRLSDPPLAIVEAQIRYNRGKGAAGLPGRVKLGAFEHFGRYDDGRYGVDDLQETLGLNSVLHGPTGGVYGIIDQQIYRLPGDDDEADDGDKDDDGPVRGVGVFARLIGAPSTRNPVDLYADAGMSALGLVPGRPNDVLGLAGALAKISSPTAELDLTGGPLPARDFEVVLEATYQAQVVPGLTVQPTFQYIIHPSGNVANPALASVVPIRNAAVTGATVVVKF